jgi:hypothetical protein
MIRALRQIFLAALAAFSLTSGAAEWTSEEAGVSFQLPSDPAWAQKNNGGAGIRFVLQRADRSAAVAFIASEKKAGPRILKEDFVKSRERGNSLINRGAEKVSSEFFTFKGKRAYKASDRVTKAGVKGVKMTNTYILWVEDDRLFEIAATKEDGDPLQDTVIKEFVDSMKFVSKSPK